MVKQYKALVGYDQVELEFQPEALEAVADKAIRREIGTRGLRAVLEEVMNHIMYEIPSDRHIQKIVITPECVNEGAEPQVTYSSDEKERPRLGRATLAAREQGDGHVRSNVS